MLRIALPALALAFWAAGALAQTIVFGNGRAMLEVPPGYTHRLEDKNQTIALIPPSGLFEMRFTYYGVPQRADHPQLAREFVLDVAKQKNKQVNVFKGTQNIGFLERGPPALRDGEEYRTLQGLMTLGQGYVALLLTVPERNVQRPEMREFMKEGIEPRIARVKSRGGK